MAGALWLLSAYRVEEFLLYIGLALLVLALLPVPIITRLLTKVVSFKIVGPLTPSLFVLIFALACTVSQMVEAHQRGVLLADDAKMLFSDRAITKEKLFRAQRNMYLSMLTFGVWLFVDRVLALQREIHTLRAQATTTSTARKTQ
eukprot:TRINITY_DN22111_c0_g1_i1.p1 TRINITY_DN22111_c0_g1~~TRINITY_DN22111_c0_g1_i1.p1  ORF type:complete len:145 (+),score=26.80 TRINITY_DN22111_c0_g1_i1:208-642(+)